MGDLNPRKNWWWVAGIVGVLFIVHAVTTVVRARLLPTRAEVVGAGPLLASTTGTIGEAAMQLHALSPDDPSIDVEADVVAALDESTRIRLVVGDGHDVTLFRAALRARHVDDRRVTFVPSGRPITSWSRDRLLVLGPAHPGAPTTLVAPPHAQRGPEARVNDWRIPWLLRDSLADAARVVTARFDFDGGDLIADERHVFVASPLFARNPRLAAGTVLHEVRALAQRPIIRLGDDAHPSPEHHVPSSASRSSATVARSASVERRSTSTTARRRAPGFVRLPTPSVLPDIRWSRFRWSRRHSRSCG